MSHSPIVEPQAESNSRLGENSTDFPIVSVGCQYVIDAQSCDISLLQSLDVVNKLCRSIIDSVGLNVIGRPSCHQFGAPHGVTSLYLLSESHLAIHTYPEHRLATINFVCCRDEVEFDWSEELQKQLGCDRVSVRMMRRGVWEDRVS